MLRRFLSALVLAAVLVAPASAQRIGVGVGVGAGGSGGGGTPALSSLSGSAAADAPISTVLATPASTIGGCTWSIAAQSNFSQSSSTGIVTKAAASVTAGTYLPTTSCTRTANSQTVSLSAPLSLTITAATAPAYTKYLIAAAGGRIGNAIVTLSSGSNGFRDRSPQVIANSGLQDLKLGFGNWSLGGQGYEEIGTAVVTISQAWVERPATGQIVALTFGGSRSLTLAAGPTVPFIFTDVVPATLWTGSPLAAGELLWIHKRGTIASPYALPQGPPISFTGAGSVTYNPASDPGTFDTTGPLPAISGATTRYYAALSTVLVGRYVAGGSQLAVLGIGDSITDGSGDSGVPSTVISGAGFFSRAMQSGTADYSGAIANLMATKFGAKALYASNGAGAMRRQLHQYANVTLDELVTNDALGGTSLASIVSYTSTVIGDARAAGVQKVLLSNQQPNTTSTDSWATKAGQTPSPAAFAAGGVMDGWRAQQVTWKNAGTIDGVVDTLSTVADASDTYRWASTGSAFGYVTDGTHASSLGHASQAVPTRALVTAQTITNAAAP